MPSPSLALPSALAALDDLVSLARASAIVVLDYDGTLSPLVPRPDEAVIDEPMRRAVAELASRLPVAVLSGRGLDDVAERVALPELVYAGCHGMQIRGPDFMYEHPEASVAATTIAEAASDLEARLAEIEGALVERKGLAVAAHRRMTPPERHAEVQEAVRAVAARHPSLVRKSGKMVDELLPDVSWDKGHALRWLVDRIAPGAFALYLGDDRTDEDAFRVLTTGAPILVADEPRDTAARFRLRDAAEVRAFLEGFTARWVRTDVG